MRIFRTFSDRSRPLALGVAFAVLVALMTTAPSSAGAIPSSELLFTQYVEGTSFNKALEIANTTGSSVDLSSYAVERYSNGSSTASATINLSGTLADGDVFVIAEPRANADILAVTDLQTGGANWNGDDALVLRNTNTSEIVDSIGRVGEDPGSEWGNSSVGTKDETLCRLDVVNIGDTDPSDEFDPATEWEAKGQNNIDGLGVVGCSAPPELLFTQYIEGSSNNKAIEIGNVGSGSVSLDGYTLELYSNGSATPNTTSDLTGLGAIAAGDVFVLSNGAAGPGIAAVSDASVGAVNWNGDDAIALRDPDGNAIDVFGQVGFDPGSQWESNGVGTRDETLCRDQAITTGDSDGSDAFDPSIQWTALGTDELTGLGQLGGCIVLQTSATISEVQGSGAVAALNNETVTVQAIVTSLFERGDVLDGFFIQEEASDADNNPATSEGIYVFCRNGGCPSDLAVGDLVTVNGRVTEFFDVSQVDTTNGSITKVSSGNTLPAPTNISLPAGGPTNDAATFENVESMRISVSTRLVVSEYFQLARHGEIVLTAEARPEQFTDANAPSQAGLASFLADLASRRIILDDDNNDQNDATSGVEDNEAYPYPVVGLSATNSFRGGDSITELTGVMHWSWAGRADTDAWRIRPSGEENTFVAENPRPAAPDPVGGSVTVASFNVLNYFTTLDVAGATCGPSALGCRGAHSTAELNRQRSKIVSALNTMDADVIGLIEIENDAGASVADLVTALNAVAGAGTYDYVNTGAIGGDAIKVAFVYKPAVVSEATPFAILDSSVDPTFIDDKNRPVLIQTFEEVATGARFTVAVNHLKSKGSDCDDLGDPDNNDGQANCSGTRAAAATALANYLEFDPTGSDSDNMLIIGDLNAYASEDAVTALTNFGYTDLVNQFEGPEAYSYVFDGQVGYLDHALANAALAPHVTGVDVWHINADEPSLLDYNDDIEDGQEQPFERKSNFTSLFEPGPYRSSDHDPVLIGLDLGGNPNPEPPVMCNGLVATIVGTDGDDVIVYGTEGDDVIATLDGNDHVIARGGNDVICAGEGDDIVVGGLGNDTIRGAGGNDTIQGSQGDDFIWGGEDNDLLSGGPGIDWIRGQSGSDRIFGGSQDDDLSGGPGNDWLYGGDNNDLLDGGADEDLLHGNFGQDTCVNGEDLRSCETPGDPIDDPCGPIIGSPVTSKFRRVPEPIVACISTSFLP